MHIKIFRYSALDHKGDIFCGHCLMPTKQQAVDFLKEKNLDPIRIRKQSLLRHWWLGYASYHELIRLFMYLDYGFKANQALIDILKESIPSFSRKWQGILSSISEELVRGSLLSESCCSYPFVFSPVVVSLIHLGESAGTFSNSCHQICEHLKKNHAYRHRLWKALAYPVFSLMGLIVCIFFLNMTLIPEFKEILLERPSSFSHITHGILWLSEISWLSIIMGLVSVAGVSALTYILFYPRSMIWFEFVFLYAFPFGHYYARAELVKFLEAFRLLYEHNMPLMQALSIAQKSIHLQYVRRFLDRAYQEILGGSSLCDALQSVPFLNDLSIRFLRAGEANGSLKESLSHTADIAMKDLENALDKLIETVGPCMLLGVGVLFIVMISGTFLPLYENLEVLPHG